MGVLDLHIMCAEEVSTFTRPMSVHVDLHDIEVYINECEHLYIIPAVGYGVFKSVVCGEAGDGEAISGQALQILLNGGEWECRDGCGNKVSHYCQGLKAALAYFVYARCMKVDGSIAARTGFMRHKDSYAEHVERKEKISQYNEVMDVAERYLGGCVKFINSVMNHGMGKVRGTRCRIKAIGD